MGFHSHWVLPSLVSHLQNQMARHSLKWPRNLLFHLMCSFGVMNSYFVDLKNVCASLNVSGHKLLVAFCANLVMQRPFLHCLSFYHYQKEWWTYAKDHIMAQAELMVPVDLDHATVYLLHFHSASSVQITLLDFRAHFLLPCAKTYLIWVLDCYSFSFSYYNIKY